jgi:hypothetical protein
MASCSLKKMKHTIKIWSVAHLCERADFEPYSEEWRLLALMLPPMMISAFAASEEQTKKLVEKLFKTLKWHNITDKLW